MPIAQAFRNVNGRAEISGYFLNNLTNNVFLVICGFGLSRLAREWGLS